MLGICNSCLLVALDYRKVENFLDYFNIYGLFHFGSPILANAVLSFFMHKNGFNLMSFSVIMTMSSQIAVVCFFGQILTNFVSG